MSTEDWNDLEEMYQTYDAAGNIVNDSVIESCEEEDWDYVQVTWCTFTLGTISDWEDRELTQAEQRTAGWLNRVG